MQSIKQSVSLLVAISILVADAAMNWGQGDWLSWKVIFASSFFSLLAFLDRLREFRIGGSEIYAQMQDTINDARVTIESIREITLLMTSIGLTTVAASGRFGGVRYEMEQEFYERAKENLRKLGATAAEIGASLEHFRKYTAYDYAYFILGAHNVPVAPQNIIGQLREEWDALIKFESHGTPDEIEMFLKKYHLLTNEHVEDLKDYRHYMKEFEHRRPDVWRDWQQDQNVRGLKFQG